MTLRLGQQAERFAATRCKTAPPVINRDVAYVRDTAARIAPPRAPGLDRPDPSKVLLLIGAALCVVLALAAIGLGTLVLAIAHHWRGAVQLAFYCAVAAWLVWVVALCSRPNSRGQR